MLISRVSQMLATAVLFGIGVFAVYFSSQLQFSEQHENLFRTDERQFARYQHFSDKFPAEQQEISILIQSHGVDGRRNDLFTANTLSTLLDAHRLIDELPAVANIASIFSVPRLNSLATRASNNDVNALIELRRKLSNPAYWPSSLLSEDQSVMVFVVALAANGDLSESSIKELLRKIAFATQEHFADSPLVAQVTGFPSLRISLRDQIKADTVKYTVFAFFLSTLTAYMYFRSAALVVATLIGPLSAVLWVFGLMSAAGLAVNVLTQMVGVLILVVAYTDALHLMAHCRHALRSGHSTTLALSTTLARVGPACLLTSLTSAAGFISLALSESSVIAQFGIVCAVGALSGFVAVMLSLPMMVSICQYHCRQNHGQNLTPDNTYLFGQSVHVSKRKPVTKKFWNDSYTVFAGVLLTFVLLVSTTQLETNYTFTENLPGEHPATAALALADDKMGGLLPLHVMLEWSSDAPPTRRKMVADIRALQSLLKQATDRDWYSISDLIRLAPGFGTMSKLKQIPPFAADHFFKPKDRVAIVTTHMSSAGASNVRQLMETVYPVLHAFDQKNTELTVEPAGFLSLVGTGSQYMISDLGKSLFGATVVIFGLNFLLFRSLKLSLMSLMPNIAPIVAVSAVLVWSGEPLRYSSVVLFSICLGLAIDDTVHYLVRFRQHLASGMTISRATRVTSTEVGKVLILTTLVMCAGFSALLFSTTPAVVTMGALACVALLMALASDILLLPALLRKYYE